MKRKIKVLKEDVKKVKIYNLEYTCSLCKGTGKHMNDIACYEPCPMCEGSGKTETKIYEV